MSNAIQILVDQAKEKAEQCAKDLARTRQNLAQAQNKLDMLENYLNQCHSSMYEKTTSGVTGFQLRSQLSFTSKIDDAIAQQKTELEFLKRTEDHQLTQWHLALADEKKFQALLDREAARKEKLENKRDQKMNDEYAARIYRVRTAGESA
jgi:flagellar protein FliJ